MQIPVRRQTWVSFGRESVYKKLTCVILLTFAESANTNIVPSAMWMIYETFRDPSLLARVRDQISQSFKTREEALSIKFDVESKHSLPLIKSIYAEVLRLRIHVYCVRYTGKEELHINKWTIPKEKILLVATAPAQSDESFWNTKNGTHPLDTFWAERFLVYPNDPQSGPVKRQASANREDSFDSKESGRQPIFSLEGTEGLWIPYGGGTRSCPGRFFSKQVMVSLCVLMTTLFDLEILAGEKAGNMNPLFYGFGGQHPNDKIPFRIRKRVLGFHSSTEV